MAWDLSGQTCGKLVKGIMAREFHVRPTDIEPAVYSDETNEMKVLARDGGDRKMKKQQT